ncbi:DUF4328 domain-containing protein [Streptomyces sp. NPDC005496]|uniref:DUF4328 domain-containing protein n=1 Tax=Streptomyces sp. NPDC005496 TaxID=3364716 RepID=UPI00368B28CD
MPCSHCRRAAAPPGETLCHDCAATAPAEVSAPAEPLAAVGAATVPAPGTAAGPPVTPPPVAPDGPSVARPAPRPPGVRPLHSPQGPLLLRSPVGLGQATAVLLGLVAAADLFALGAEYAVRDIVGRGAAGVADPGLLEAADRAEALYDLAGTVQTALLTATAVVFLVWFRRARDNAEVFDPHGHTMARGWTFWSWFVPLVNLWFPRRIMMEIWDASRPSGVPGRRGLVNWWWACWVISLTVDRLGRLDYREVAGTAAADAQVLVETMMFTDVVQLVAAVFAVLVVLRLTRMQDRKAHEGALPAGF